jgi:hypothetical protein
MAAHFAGTWPVSLPGLWQPLFSIRVEEYTPPMTAAPLWAIFQRFYRRLWAPKRDRLVDAEIRLPTTRHLASATPGLVIQNLERPRW